jgi:hypothetical protein
MTAAEGQTPPRTYSIPKDASQISSYRGGLSHEALETVTRLLASGEHLLHLTKPAA